MIVKDQENLLRKNKGEEKKKRKKREVQGKTNEVQEAQKSPRAFDVMLP